MQQEPNISLVQEEGARVSVSAHSMIYLVHLNVRHTVSFWPFRSGCLQDRVADIQSTAFTRFCRPGAVRTATRFDSQNREMDLFRRPSRSFEMRRFAPRLEQRTLLHQPVTAFATSVTAVSKHLCHFERFWGGIPESVGFYTPSQQCY